LKVLALILIWLKRLVKWLPLSNRKLSGRLAITLNATAETSSESLESTNSSPEHGLRMDSSEHKKKRIDYQKERSDLNDKRKF